jgi:acyl-coenzyme A thioesterase 13
VPAGDTVLVECSVVHAGRRLCTITGVMKRESTGEVSSKSSIPEVSGSK